MRMHLNFDTVDELSSYLRSEEFQTILSSLFNKDAPLSDEEKAAILQQLKDAERQIKSQYHPEQKHPILLELKSKAIESLERSTQSPDDQSAREEYLQVLQEISRVRADLSEEFKNYERVVQSFSNRISSIVNSLSGQGRSNRAARAGLLNAHAGVNNIQGVGTDKHGNAKGTEFDLGKDGAFSEFEIIVFQLYSFDSSYTKKAFDQKGFKYQWYNSIPSLDQFTQILEGEKVCQCWIISQGSSPHFLQKGHLEVLKSFHQRGKSLYIWGDNEPFYIDGNLVLEHLFHKDLTMFGNEPGGKVVQLCDSLSKKGREPHMVTTGLVHLFEGITVASFHEKLVEKHGFSPLFWGSAENLISIVKPADELGGAVIADGAFTRLYCNVDDAGTIRYIINSACWLAVESLPPDVPELNSSEELPLEDWNPENAFSEGVCAILYEPVPIVSVSVMKLADPESNTTDFVLNDPLAFGEENSLLFGRYLYGDAAGKSIMEVGKDPYLRLPVAGLLPAVDLSNPMNLRLFTDELCRVFMGGRKLYSAARLLFIGVLDALLDPERKDVDPDDEDFVRLRSVCEYLLSQGLENFTSTSSFTDIGKQIKLIDAMRMYFTVEDPFVQISKSFSTVTRIGRILMEYRPLKVEEEQSPSFVKSLINQAIGFVKGEKDGNQSFRKGSSLVSVEDVCRVVQRSFVKLLINQAIGFVKEQSSGGENGNDSFRNVIIDSCYQAWNFIPVKGSGRLMLDFPEFVKRESFVHALNRFERVAGKSVSFSAVNTWVFYLLLEKDLRMWRVEGLLKALIAEDSHFASFWNQGTLIDEDWVIDKLNAPYRVFVGSPDHQKSSLVPFVSTSGPTVFSCTKCGVVFGNPSEEPTLEYSETVKRNRNKHFREHLNSDVNGYPTATSQHYSLHRAVQVVIRDFPGQTELIPEMVLAVAKYLRKSAKGFIYRDTLEQEIRAGLQSYLDLRKQGQPDPPGNVNFHERFLIERDILLKMKEKE